MGEAMVILRRVHPHEHYVGWCRLPPEIRTYPLQAEASGEARELGQVDSFYGGALVYYHGWTPPRPPLLPELQIKKVLVIR